MARVPWWSLARWIRLVLAVLALWAPPAGGAADERVIVALGDSLTAGLGVAPDESYPARLQERLAGEGYRYRIVNAGVSGDTTAGALRRLAWALRARPAIVIVALGANDGLRGQAVPEMRRNLEEIIARCRARGARVLLAGMRLPPNYGDQYTRVFARTFPQVAARTGVAFMPFLLDGVAAAAALNQPDGIHPNARGHAIIAERLWPYLKPLLSPPASWGRPDAAGPRPSPAGDGPGGMSAPERARRRSRATLPSAAPRGVLVRGDAREQSL